MLESLNTLLFDMKEPVWYLNLSTSFFWCEPPGCPSIVGLVISVLALILLASRVELCLRTGYPTVMVCCAMASV